jgi:hypothetical protein
VKSDDVTANVAVGRARTAAAIAHLNILYKAICFYELNNLYCPAL